MKTIPTKKLLYFLIPMGIGSLFLTSATIAQGKFSILGDWSGSPDCPITFYRDNGTSVYGNCDNGSYQHIFQGEYTGTNRINLTVTRIDPKKCRTNAMASLKILGPDIVKYSQEGWHGCGVNTGPGSQVWERR
jgi:hypothetical protein